LGPAVFFAAVALRAFFGLFDIMKFTGETRVDKHDYLLGIAKCKVQNGK
jgi:hypothetical protein